MKLNERTVIEGGLVYLVPYGKHHVEKYHEWMKSPELQFLTSSEPLTLEQEYEMQRSWREDSDINKNIYNETKDEVKAMIGDTNLFLCNVPGVGELEIMIAERSARGRGLGKEAILLMIRYCITNLNIKIFQANILQENLKSISLFEKIGFKQVQENKIFHELIFKKEVCNSWIDWLKLNTPNYAQEEK